MITNDEKNNNVNKLLTPIKHSIDYMYSRILSQKQKEKKVITKDVYHNT